MATVAITAPPGPRERGVPRVAGAWRFALGLGVFLGCQGLLRLALSSSLSWDESEQILLSQSWAWGYSEQPPLYTWLLIGVFRVLGRGLAAMTAFKIGLFAGLFGLAYRLGCRCLHDDRRAALASFALLLMPFFLWEAFRDGTHSILLAVCVMGLTDAAVRWLRSGRTRDYLAIGGWVAAALLAKYNAAIPITAMVLASAVEPNARRRLLDPRTLLSVAIALVGVLPHGLWLHAHFAEIRDSILARADLEAPSRLPNWVNGLGSLAFNLAIMAGPLLIGLAWLQPAVATRRTHPRDSWTAVESWLGWTWVFTVAVLVMSIALGAKQFMSHWFPPLFVALPVYGFLRMRQLAIPRPKLRHAARTLLVLMVLSIVARGSQLFLGGPAPGQPRLAGRDRLYAEAAKLWNPGDRRGVLVIVDDLNVGGNLLLHCPQVRVWCVRYQTFQPIGADARTVRIVWNASRSAEVPELLRASVRRIGAANPSFVSVGPARADRRYHTLAYVDDDRGVTAFRSPR